MWHNFQWFNGLIYVLHIIKESKDREIFSEEKRIFIWQLLDSIAILF